MPLDQKTFDSLKGLWEEAGGGAGYADVAAAIAFAESTGCQYALAGPRDIRPVKTCTWNKTNGENSCGYWQINLFAHTGYSAPSIFDPLTNAQAAVSISNHGKDFGPWTTYTDGAYKVFLQAYAGQPAGPPPGGGGGGTSTPPGTPAVLQDATWNQGWQHFTDTLAHKLPASLNESARLRRAALQNLSRGRSLR